MTKTNNIKHIPTDLNYFYNLNTKLKRLKKQGNTSRLLIIVLIIWNIILSLQLIPVNIPQFTDKQNEQIMQLEEIPTEQLKF